MGWLCDAKRHPKPFTIPVIQESSGVFLKLPLAVLSLRNLGGDCALAAEDPQKLAR
jgi:hypothetical protein